MIAMKVAVFSLVLTCLTNSAFAGTTITITANNQVLCEGQNLQLTGTVTDTTHSNNWYKWQVSTNGGYS